jgi:hypothetical protein
MLSPAHPGMSQPPRKSVAITMETVSTCAYSAMKNMENFIEEYSVWYPVTSSDSASGRSKGRRFVSAKAEIQKKKNDAESGSANQSPSAAAPDDLRQRHVADQEEDAQQAHPQRDLVGDHLRAGAQPAQQRVLVRARPPGDHDPEHAERREGEQEEDPDRHVGDHHRHHPPRRRERRGERDHREGHQRRDDGEHRREREEDPVRLARVRLLLEDVLQPVGDRLRDAPGTHAVRAERSCIQALTFRSSSVSIATSPGPAVKTTRTLTTELTTNAVSESCLDRGPFALSAATMYLRPLAWLRVRPIVRRWDPARRGSLRGASSASSAGVGPPFRPPGRRGAREAAAAPARRARPKPAAELGAHLAERGEGVGRVAGRAALGIPASSTPRICQAGRAIPGTCSAGQKRCTRRSRW